MTETMLTLYEYWLTANEDDLREQWNSMKEVEQYEMGKTFENYCQLQYTDGYGL